MKPLDDFKVRKPLQVLLAAGLITNFITAGVQAAGIQEIRGNLLEEQGTRQHFFKQTRDIVHELSSSIGEITSLLQTHGTLIHALVKTQQLQQESHEQLEQNFFFLDPTLLLC